MGKQVLWRQALPNAPTTVVEQGMSQRLTLFSPDVVPSCAATALNGPGAGLGYETVGVPRVLFRNTRGYPYHLPDTARQWAAADPGANDIRKHALLSLRAVDRRYKTSVGVLVPEVVDDLIAAKMESTVMPTRRCDRQGNALATTTTDEYQYLWAPMGETLQHLHCFRRDAGACKGTRWTRFSPSPTLVNTVRQIAPLGDPQAPAAIARGDANVTVVRLGAATVDVVETLRFRKLVGHVACSPHAPAEAMFIDKAYELSQWTPEGGLRSMGPPVQEQWQRAEYSSHPCVLWTATKDTIGTFDTRMRSPAGFQRDWIYNLHGASAIYDLKRHPSCPFQFIVRTGVSLEVFDSRSARHSVMHWADAGLFPEVVTRGRKEPTFGAVAVVDVSSARQNHALLLSSSSVLNKVAVHSYAVQRDAADMERLRPLRHARGVDPVFQAATPAAPFDVHLPDNSAGVFAVGVAGLSAGGGVHLFQLSSVGDLFCHALEATPATAAAVQAELPCGMTLRHDDAAHLPQPSGAFQPAPDAASIAIHTLFNAGAMRRGLAAATARKDTDATACEDADSLKLLQPAALRRHLRACRGSATLHVLQQTWAPAPAVRVLMASLRAAGGVVFHRVRPHNRTEHTARHLQARGDAKADAPGADDACTCTDDCDGCDAVDCRLVHLIVVSEAIDDVSRDVKFHPEPSHSYRPLPRSSALHRPANVNAHDFVLDDLRAAYGLDPFERSAKL
ncbi:hypothetical protein ACHHYP_10487 [Achlya hypogyna]|uniref:Uncharacterized protein n=1 Tax=Achlya hypogyna TaxID=1202772 RepID=A0A1V9YL97_ACHHY|nr:hypothetical protein ACHHYP_10487 [Achlya hypogyna]